MIRAIVGALVGCVLISAVGGFGAPLLCQRAADRKACGDLWGQAATGSLTAAGILSGLLAKVGGSDSRP